MSLAIFKGTYLLGELALHERAREMGRRLKLVRVTNKMPDYAFNYSKYHYFSTVKSNITQCALTLGLKIFQAVS